MERVTGVGGVFFRARDPETLLAWYRENLGVPVTDGYVIFPESSSTHWIPFSADTDYWPSDKQWMVNFTVRDLDAMLPSFAPRASQWTTGSRSRNTDGSAGRPIRKAIASSSGSRR